MTGIDSHGHFNKKSVDEIREDMKRNLQNELGFNISEQPENPLMDFIDAVSVELARQWDSLEDVYYMTFFQDSFGEQVDKHLEIAGAQREKIQPATGEVTFSRDSPAPDDIVIPSGTVVQTARTETRPPIPFETTESALIDEGDTEVTNVPIEALKPWQTDLDEEWLGEETNLPAGTITRFETPVSGVDSVTNPKPTGDVDEGFQLGQDREMDDEFKLRYLRTLGQLGSATRAAVQAAVINAHPDISSVLVNEVRRPAENEYGLNVVLVAEGVPDDDIAEAIFESRAGGLDTFGDEFGQVEFEGETFTEFFDRATAVNIEIEAAVLQGDTYPADGDDQIIDSLVSYLGGIDTNDVFHGGLGINDDVIYDQVKQQIMGIRGVVQADVEIAKVGDVLGTDNIIIDETEAARTEAEHITITEQ